jgi:hypothetical protein
MLDKLQRSDFEQLVGQEFSLATEGKELPLRLLEASRLGPTSGNPERAPFALLLRGPNDPPLNQGIFLVPIGPDAEGLCYEVLFN